MNPSTGYRPGVGIMLANASGLVFVAERLDTPGAWQMPQGGLDKGEDPAAAALRELHEETGVTKAALIARTAGWLRYDFPEDRRGAFWKGRFMGQEQLWFAARFLGDDADISLIGHGHDAEFSAWKWVRPAELPDLIVPFKRPVYKAVVADLAPMIAA